MTAGKLGTSAAEIEAVLSVLQSFDPPGICARDLAECLTLQLKERNRFDPAMQALVGHLDMVARRDIAALKKVCAVDDEDLAEMIAEIWGGEAFPFPPISDDGWIALAGDERGSAMEVYPIDVVLRESDGDADAHGEYTGKTAFTATHGAMATSLTSEAVLAIAEREGWPAKYRKRGGMFGVIELWIEGRRFRPIAKGGRIQAARLTDPGVADIVKGHARRAGLDPKHFAGHSLRSGFLTSAAARGASIFKMVDQSWHKSKDTLRGYVRNAEIFKDHRGKDLL